MYPKCFLFFLLVVLKASGLYAQTPSVAVQYVVKVNYDNPLSRTNESYNLVIMNQESIYYNTLKDSLSDFPHKAILDEPSKIGVGTLVKKSDELFVNVSQDVLYKNYAQDTMFLNSELPSTRNFILLSEPLRLFEWSILPNSDTLILGYKCQGAKADFRGRTYTAYFSSQLHAFGGPWKFDGLPGLILQVQCHEKFLVIEPYKIVLNAPLDPIRNPYPETKKPVLNWEQYKFAFNKRSIEHYRFMKVNLAEFLPAGITFKSSSTKGRYIEDLGVEDINDSNIKELEEKLKKTEERLQMENKSDNKK